MTVSEAEWCQPDFVHIVTCIPYIIIVVESRDQLHIVICIERNDDHFDENNLCGSFNDST